MSQVSLFGARAPEPPPIARHGPPDTTVTDPQRVGRMVDFGILTTRWVPSEPWPDFPGWVPLRPETTGQKLAVVLGKNAGGSWILQPIDDAGKRGKPFVTARLDISDLMRGKKPG